MFVVLSLMFRLVLMSLLLKNRFIYHISLDRWAYLANNANLIVVFG